MIRRRTPLKRSTKPIPRSAVKRSRKKVSGVGWETLPDGREICSDAEYKLRLGLMCQRQGWYCAICGKSLYGYVPSFDHESGRGANGAHRDDRIEVDGDWQNAALCIPCNGDKGSKRYHWVGGKYVPKTPHKFVNHRDGDIHNNAPGNIEIARKP